MKEIILEIIIRARHPIFHLIVILLFLGGCAPDSPNLPASNARISEDGTADMIAELKAIANDKSNIQLWHLNKERAKAMDAKIPEIQDIGTKLSMSFKASAEWLNAGEYDIAIEKLQELLELINTENYKLPPKVTPTIEELLGVAYLRKAEVENCLENHNSYSCLIPIEKPGQHLQRSPAENALKRFENILKKDPNNTQVKWLYNIAQMTLGGYPKNIKPNWLIPPEIFESGTTIPRFEDRAMSLGLAVNDISGSVVMDDFNNDHYLDLMVSSYGLDDQLRYFQNNGKGGFDEKTTEANLTGLLSGLNMIQADYDNDGWLDLLILRGAWLGKEGKHPNSLLRNNGDGSFSDVTKAAGVYCKFPTQTASWGDYNNDGFIDLFIANEFSKNINAPCQLFQNNGDGTFKDVAVEKGAAIKAFIKGCIFGDYNNDGYPDLYLSVQNGENYLLKNSGPSNDYAFTNVSSTAGTQQPIQSFPCWFFDYNQDGWEDIFVSGFDSKKFESAAGEVAKDYLGEKHSSELPRLYQNNQDGTFTEVSKQTGVDKVLFTMGCNFGELNNDGYPDFYAATGTPDFRAQIPNRMFLNLGGEAFTDVSKSGGFGHLQKGHGVAFGDMDMDGDQDIYHVLGGSYDGDNFMNALFMNPGNENYWVKLKLEGNKSNRSAIGAKVTITAKNAKGELRKFYAKVNSGGSFGANPLCIEQGLLDYSKIQNVAVIWPGETTEEILNGISSNNYWKIDQGMKTAKIIKAEALQFSGDQHNHH